MATVAQYEGMASQALRELADLEGAFVASEAKAKIADRRWLGLTKMVDPNHISTALGRLIAAGELASTAERTRGRRVIRVYHRPIQRGNTRRIQDASARKRLLHTRYQSWASGTKHGGAGAVGPGLEIVVHRSLQAAAQFGYRLLNPTAISGEVRELFGAPVPGGPLDNGALLTTYDQLTMATSSYLMVLEAKNLRQWIYPRTQELHQLMAKAAAIQVSRPELRSCRCWSAAERIT